MCPARRKTEVGGAEPIKLRRIDDFGFAVAEPDVPGDGPRGGALVSGQHDSLDAAVVQLVHQLAQAAAYRTAKSHKPDPNKSLDLYGIRAKASPASPPRGRCERPQP